MLFWYRFALWINPNARNAMRYSRARRYHRYLKR